ncbi:bifunctional diguanylate cyclase/phosphodiesterase, partial [bacterium]
MSVSPTFANLESLPFPLLAIGGAGETLFANGRWRRQFDLSGEQVFKWSEVLDAATLERWEREFETASKYQVAFQIEATVETGGNPQRYLFSFEPQIDKSELDQAELKWLVAATEIDALLEKVVVDYEQDQVALSMSAQRWYSFFRESATGKAIVTLDGDMLAVNAQLCSLFGYSEEELLQ